ncbi:hypothetical protein MMC26_006310 [Xylographa opegraphella]|nr:hypothetical protein [Xylographa opegraphella]
MESSSSTSPELIFPLRYQELEDFFFTVLMATVDVDQKFLGRSAKRAGYDNPFLSSMLYKVLGLSVILTKKLVRARKLRRLDTTRDTKSLQLYHHIIWLSRECLVLVEQYILPMVASHVELKVLAYKLRASLYHNFVLYHNQPSINRTAIPSYTATSNKGKDPERSSLRSSPIFNDSVEGGPVRQQGSLPPGLTRISVPKPSASFLLPAVDYIPTASSCFTMAAALADELLPGSHPLRLSVKLEYAAYLYDCLHDGDASRSLARQSIRDVYEAEEGMNDDMFDDAAFLVGYLGKMMRRGMSASGTSGSTPRNGSVAAPSTPLVRDTPYSDNGIPPARPNPGTQNQI